jgi:hypothetical protein
LPLATVAFDLDPLPRFRLRVWGRFPDEDSGIQIVSIQAKFEKQFPITNGILVDQNRIFPPPRPVPDQ